MSAPDYKICFSCGGLREVEDLGAKEKRPCAVCRKVEYAAWISERQPATQRFAVLDDKGRCCGRKPLVYKRPNHHFYCTRCCASLDPNTGEQQENWAWRWDGAAFVATHPTSEYAASAA